MKGAPVLHWPKLFEGQVWVNNYHNSGDGVGYGAGYGDDCGNCSFNIKVYGSSYS